ncbi:uncharacterized protein LOC126905913 [Daktulosphaira vitifoliae]|uniref:uncharacterized protein LOC126905913 n=1 Tax=Daktulosphaira vitifoliae TaxID=58002 RepID=UPI0021A9A2D2|nr:uncharacterized protein LOC126905913 [Daktulosphaira vitifoliae]
MKFIILNLVGTFLILRSVADKEVISKEGIQEDVTTFMNSLDSIGIHDFELRSVLKNDYKTKIEDELFTLGSQFLNKEKKLDKVVNEMTNFILVKLANLYDWYKEGKPLYEKVKECSTTFFTSIKTKFKPSSEPKILRSVADKEVISKEGIQEDKTTFMNSLDSIGITDNEFRHALGNQYQTKIEDELFTLGSQFLNKEKKLDKVANEMTNFILVKLANLYDWYKEGKDYHKDVIQFSTTFFTSIKTKFKPSSEPKILRSVADKEEISKEGILEEKNKFMKSLESIEITDNELRSVLENDYQTKIENELLTLGSQLLKGDKKMDDVVTQMTNFILKDLAILYVWYNVGQPFYNNVKEFSTKFFSSFETKFKPSSKPKKISFSRMLKSLSFKGESSRSAPDTTSTTEENWPIFRSNED